MNSLARQHTCIIVVENFGAFMCTGISFTTCVDVSVMKSSSISLSYGELGRVLPIIFLFIHKITYDFISHSSSLTLPYNPLHFYSFRYSFHPSNFHP